MYEIQKRRSCTIEFLYQYIKQREKICVYFQHGRSLVAVDHLFTLIASAAAKFNLEQLNHLIGFIHNVILNICFRTFILFSEN